ncbi:hypothetical protein ZEAMMB73_Zm00001d023756 [Zea mays]|uniref:Uncharacterized protein n=1 Tax=Zea mays TaxID=4577 RepID=A0A1D6IVE8_MAIZE|nr:hypothetical protein ZEAMMB73_Zm00001d023756 [Zea mays]
MTIGVALLLDLTSRLPRAGASAASAAVRSHPGLSTTAFAATAAAALSSSGVPLSARHLFGTHLIMVTIALALNLHHCKFGSCVMLAERKFPFHGFTVAHCDAGTPAGWNDGSDDLVNEINTKIIDSLQYARKDYFQNTTKEYPSELKPLFSAFGLKNFTITTLRSFLLYYLPLIQPKPHTGSDDEDDDLLHDTQEKTMDLVTPFYNSVKQIVRETSIVTTRRVFERIVVRHVSQRTAWKLLKGNNASLMRSLDISKSYHYALGYCGFMDPLFGDNRHCIISSCSCCALGDVAGPIIAIIVFKKMQLPL